MTSIIGLTCLAIILASWLGGVKYPRGLPAGPAAIVVGLAIAWVAPALGFPGIGGISAPGLADSLAGLGFSVALPAIDHVFSGFEFLGLILATAMPFGVFVIGRRFDTAAAFAAAGAVLAFFGFMHRPAVGVAVTPMVAVACAMVADR